MSMSERVRGAGVPSWGPVPVPSVWIGAEYVAGLNDAAQGWCLWMPWASSSLSCVLWALCGRAISLN